MNRTYTKEEFIELSNVIRDELPGVGISTDIIVGFPGENKKEFHETLDVMNEVVFDSAFTFKYSSRPGTKAAELEITDKEELKNRLIIIQEKIFSNQIELNKSLAGKTLEVLVENKLKNQNKFFGRNKFLNSVIFDGDESHIGKLIPVNIEKSNQNSLFGKIKDEMRAA